ncbi:MAG: hypothetical protein HKM95_03070 [Inquilinus sp.]|nr:hypothetical protein [Inquilinus sp.]
MHIESMSSNGYVIRCERGHSFRVRTLGPSVECPKCGQTALSADLTTAYYLGALASPRLDTAFKPI